MPKSKFEPNECSQLFLPAILVVLALILICQVQTSMAITNAQYVQNMTDFPYLARFSLLPPFDDITCTASILSANYILTAAHCFRFAALRPTFNAVVTQTGVFYNLTDILPTLGAQIQVGQPDVRSADTIVANLTQLAVPPGYPYPTGAFVNNNPHLWEKDMVILRLAQPLQLSDIVQPVKLLNEKGYEKLTTDKSDFCIMAGWGGNDTYRLSYGTWKIACTDFCAYGAIVYYDFWQNKRNFSNTFYTDDMLAQVGDDMALAVSEGLVCGAPNPSNMQGGNSGGPAVVKSRDGTSVYQIGVISNNLAKTSALNCARGTGFIFTRTTVECDWIDTLTNGEVKCSNYN